MVHKLIETKKKSCCLLWAAVVSSERNDASVKDIQIESKYKFAILLKQSI